MDIISAFTTNATALKECIGILKDAKELLPPGPEKANVEMKITQTEKALQLAEVKTAELLGYQLCKCAFPPKIMLIAEGSTVQGMKSVEVFKCPDCGKITPTEEELIGMKQQKERAIQRARGYSVQ